jgi:hypothetical protein
MPCSFGFGPKSLFRHPSTSSEIPVQNGTHAPGSAESDLRRVQIPLDLLQPPPPKAHGGNTDPGPFRIKQTAFHVPRGSHQTGGLSLRAGARDRSNYLALDPGRQIHQSPPAAHAPPHLGSDSQRRYYWPNSPMYSTCFSSLKKIFSHSARLSNKVEVRRKKFCSDSFRFLFCSTCFRIYGISFSYLRKPERGFFRPFLWNPILSGIDPYLFRFSSHFQSIWDMSRN